MSALRRATVTLGRDGMGSDATAEDFDAWVSYVTARIDEATGLDVTVEERGPRDVQDDDVRAESDEDRNVCCEAIQTLWVDWCEAGATDDTTDGAE